MPAPTLSGVDEDVVGRPPVYQNLPIFWHSARRQGFISPFGKIRDKHSATRVRDGPPVVSIRPLALVSRPPCCSATHSIRAHHPRRRGSGRRLDPPLPRQVTSQPAPRRLSPDPADPAGARKRSTPAAGGNLCHGPGQSCSTSELRSSLGNRSRSGSSVGMSVRLKSGRSTVRSCP